ncbi:MAG: acyl-CoA dehydrogenase, partial [Ignavibacteriales bacterium]|nr:acyl-CoA dehydrogenase [Ignavibacteriales bacterium]
LRSSLVDVRDAGVARADASLMNLFGLQDIADTINKFADDFIKDEFLPKFATGDYTGAMALTEPDAGSDLQAVKTHAYQDEQGQWRLRGVKRFITNGNGEGLLVLARSEQGTKDARGLSLFAAHADDSVVIRRIENKLGIHGSPTCEMQFNDTPAKLVGNRKFGLIKYVFDLMYRARMGVSAQALGVAQAAYEEALKYAKEREQFGKPIYELPAVANILIDMRVRLESMRSLFYYSTYFVDMKEKTEELIARKKANGESFVEQNIEAKKYTRMANLLTPLSKFICAEGANTVSYDSLQIHGGTGYMREFKVERLARDARITNIYEGTSQLQIVAATGPVLNDVMKEQFEEWGAKEYKGGLERLDTFLKDIREIYKSSLKFVLDKKDPTFQEVAAKDIVELYSYIVIGYLLLQEATEDQRKVFVANRYIVNALSLARKNAEAIKNEAFSDIMHADKILV